MVRLLWAIQKQPSMDQRCYCEVYVTVLPNHGGLQQVVNSQFGERTQSTPQTKDRALVFLRLIWMGDREWASLIDRRKYFLFVSPYFFSAHQKILASRTVPRLWWGKPGVRLRLFWKRCYRGITKIRCTDHGEEVTSKVLNSWREKRKG